MSTSRSEHLPFGYSSQHTSQARSTSPATGHSPIDPTNPSTLRSPFGLPPGSIGSGKMANPTRSGTGSPSHEMSGSSRLFPKRAREIQAQEGLPGLPLNPWGGPPTSGNSTPLRENIPESPTDGFPDFAQVPPTQDASAMPQARRARAGTVPSRFSPGGAGAGLISIPGIAPSSSRPSPTEPPFKSPSPGLEAPETTRTSGSTLLSRLRAGSMPQRSPFGGIPGTSSPFGFGPTIFGGSWNPVGITRERGATLASIASMGSNNPSSPAQSAFSRDGGAESDVHMRTLDYLGLAETPQPPRAQLATPYYNNDASKASRFRSYSVNNKDKYDDDDEEAYDDGQVYDPQYAARLEAQLAVTHAAIQKHNMAVQAFASHPSLISRPRARTAGVLDTPGSRMMGTYLSSSQSIPNPMVTAEIRLPEEEKFDDLPQAVAAMNIGRSNSRNAALLGPDEPQGLEGPTSALWLGSIPASTTTSTLNEMFKPFGSILSVRVLTHKSCGFVNYDRVESAVAARNALNGKEIFPGSGPIRINFAKPPSASNTPGHDGVYPSPSPVPFGKGQDGAGQGGMGSSSLSKAASSSGSQAASASPAVRPLRDMVTDILEIVKHFGATEDDQYKVSGSLQSAIQFTDFADEIPPIQEPSHTRIHDAPKLRDIRKKIDNQTLSQGEIEAIAVEMLPEIAELSSDYLGNTVVQKLFEHCSDDLRDAMLAEIAPHMAEIGVHKNGTWAAQKIIDVCKTPRQLNLIVEHLRPYTVPLFLDQYGNYVLQGCLKFGAPYNNFIFETMLSKMWEIAQGRFGARAMRACLESHHATKDQQRMLAAAIALHSVQLSTNANGALLLTWFLDTCTFPQRRTVLSPQLVPHLVHLCTHKVAYLTVLKVINQKTEPEARDTILQALFLTPNDQVLEAILSDHTCGATLIFKVLTTPFFDDSIRGQVIETVKNVLIRIKAQPNQGYKRLMDEVGLSTRNPGAGAGREHGPSSNTSGEHRQRPTSRQNSQHHHHGHAAPSNKQFYNQHPPAGNTQGYDMGYGSQRPDVPDASMQPFPTLGSQPPMYGQGPGQPMNVAPPMPYQQGMGPRGTPPVGNFFPTMQAGPGYNGFSSPSPALDPYRNQGIPNGPSMQAPVGQAPPVGPSQAAFGPPPGFGMGPPGMGAFNGYAGGGMSGGMPNMGYMQQEQVNARRGRR